MIVVLACPRFKPSHYKSPFPVTLCIVRGKRLLRESFALHLITIGLSDCFRKIVRGKVQKSCKIDCVRVREKGALL